MCTELCAQRPILIEVDLGQKRTIATGQWQKIGKAGGRIADDLPVPLPLWLPPIEIFKPIAQAVAVTAGVFFGWRLNGWSQRSDRVRQAQAEWAGAAEEYLTAHEADQAAWARLQAGSSDPALALSDRQAIRRELEDARGKLRASTVRLLLVGWNSAMKKVEIVKIEGELLLLDRSGGTGMEFHSKVQLARVSVRLAVAKWTGRKA